MSDKTVNATDDAVATEAALPAKNATKPNAKNKKSNKKAPALKVEKSGEILRVPVLAIQYDNP